MLCLGNHIGSHTALRLTLSVVLIVYSLMNLTVYDCVLLLVFLQEPFSGLSVVPSNVVDISR